MSEPSRWVGNLDLVSLLLGAVIGGFVSTWFNFYIKRPAIDVCGGGSGGVMYVCIRNKPGFIGVVIPETVILGSRLHTSGLSGALR